MSMAGYAKLFSRILDSTVWRESDPVRILWITMLAMADKDGVVHCTIPGLADRARVTMEQCEDGLSKFQQPDKYSWSQEEEGRKIRIVDGGWFLINHAKYRALLSREDNAEKTRIRVANWRAKGKKSVTPVTGNTSNDIASTDSSTSTKAIKIKGFAPPTLQEVIEYAKARNSKVDAVKFWNYYESNGWMVGRNKMKNWHAAFAKWERDVPENGKKSDWLPPQNVSPSYVPESVKRKKELEQARLAGL